MSTKFQNFISIVSNLPNVNVKWMPRWKVYRITYKNGGRYAWDWDIWNHVKFMYETQMKETITPDDVALGVYSKYIEVKSWR